MEASENVGVGTGEVKKTRAPKQDYGFNKAAVIVRGEQDKKYRANRAAWFSKVMAYEGQTVQSFLDANKDEKDSPRGWLRFFVQDGSVKLTASS